MAFPGPSRLLRWSRSWPARLAVGAILAGAAGFGAGWGLKPAPRLNAVAYGGERAHVINAHLRQAGERYAFLAGDSFVEHYAPETLPCGRDVVNGGVNGAKVTDYLRILDDLRFERRPAVALLSTGINDLQAKYQPTGPAALGRFRDNAEALVARLGAGGTQVVVSAVPPISEGVARYFDTASFGLYSDALRDICTRRGCRYVDPFTAMRDGAFWRATPGTSRDGLHLTELRAAFRTVYGELCR